MADGPRFTPGIGLGTSTIDFQLRGTCEGLPLDVSSYAQLPGHTSIGAGSLSVEWHRYSFSIAGISAQSEWAGIPATPPTVKGSAFQPNSPLRTECTLSVLDLMAGYTLVDQERTRLSLEAGLQGWDLTFRASGRALAHVPEGWVPWVKHVREEVSVTCLLPVIGGSLRHATASGKWELRCGAHGMVLEGVRAWQVHGEARWFFKRWLGARGVWVLRRARLDAEAISHRGYESEWRQHALSLGVFGRW